MPFGYNAHDQPGTGGDRRSPSRPVKPLATPGPTPLPTPLPTPAPIPLTHKKVPSGDVVRSSQGDIAAVSGELGATATGDVPPVRPRTGPDGFTDLALEPTVQVKVDQDGAPLELPPLRPAHAPAPAPVPAPVVRRKTPTPPPVLEPPPVRSTKTPIPARVTPAAAFDAVEADFFAREADLYKRETVDTFDDLDPGGGRDSRSPSKARRRRK
jgi:hypothetical protein